MSGEKPAYYVYLPIERPHSRTTDWHKAGAAWEVEPESILVKLDVVPIQPWDGRMLLHPSKMPYAKIRELHERKKNT
jgi:hypothetical protein